MVCILAYLAFGLVCDIAVVCSLKRRQLAVHNAWMSLVLILFWPVALLIGTMCEKEKK